MQVENLHKSKESLGTDRARGAGKEPSGCCCFLWDGYCFKEISFFNKSPTKITRDSPNCHKAIPFDPYLVVMNVLAVLAVLAILAVLAGLTVLAILAVLFCLLYWPY